MTCKVIVAAVGLSVLFGAAAGAQSIKQGVLVPDGYIPVWEDDRLNPRRGVRTATGDAQMNAIWTDDVPQQLRVAPAAPSGAATNAAPVVGSNVYQRTTGVYVQVSTYPDAASAASVAASLSNVGVRSRRGVIRRGSNETPVVLAGPYSTVAEASQTAARLQRSGYAQAFVRN